MSSIRITLMALVVSAVAATWAVGQQAKEAPPPPERAELEALAADVQARLVADRVLGAYPITAKIDQEVVALEGTVPTEQDRERISAVAARQAGKLAPFVANRVRVQEVADAAKTKTTADQPQDAVPTKLDKEQLARLKELIREAMPEADKRIHLVFRLEPIPTIVVEGVMSTYDEKLALNKLIRQNYRGLSILNNVRVHMKPETPATARVTTASSPKTPKKVAITVDEDTPPSDRKLAEKVAQALRQDKRMTDAAIMVQADNDVIWLRGSVQTNPQKVLAVTKSDGVEGVEYVIEDLTVDPSPRQDRQDRQVELLEDTDVDSYVRNYFSRRVGLNVIDVKVAQETIVVILEDDFVDQEERQIAKKSVAELEKELGRKIQIELQKRGTKSDSLR